MDMWNVRFQEFREDPRLGAMYAQMRRKPGWVTQLAIAAAAVVVIVPIVALVLTALIVGVVVFYALSLVAAIVQFFRQIFGGISRSTRNESASNGRQNVRVIPRD